MKDSTEIARQKERLIARCDGQRARLGDIIHDLRRPIAVADRGVEVARFLRAHPVVVGAAVTALVALRRRGPAGLIARALAAWQTWRTVATWADRLGVTFPRARRRGRTGDVAP